MGDLRISRRAQRDLDDIRDWGTNEFGSEGSARHLKGFLHLFALLREFPRAGEARPRWGGGLRSVSHRPHRILYRVDAGGVLIVRILHSSRDVRHAIRSKR